MLKQITADQTTAQSVSMGLLLMAGFTMLWLVWATAGIALPYKLIPLLAACILGFLFIVEGVLLLRRTKDFPQATDLSSSNKTMTTGRWFSLIVTIEMVIIAATCAVLGATGHYLYINPAIALIVGLHFFPFARLFHRTIDYYIATWVAAAGLLGVFLLSFTTTKPFLVWTLVGVAVAFGTSAYGVYMVLVKRALTQLLDASKTAKQ